MSSVKGNVLGGDVFQGPAGEASPGLAKIKRGGIAGEMGTVVSISRLQW